MEREFDNSNQLLQRIFLGLSQPGESRDNAPEMQDTLRHLRQENDALRKTLRMHNGLRQRFEQLYDSSPIGYMTISGNGCIVEANLMIARLFGIQRSWLIGQNLDHYIAEDDYRLFTRHLDYVRNTNSSDICNLRLVNSIGEHIDVRMESTPCLSEAQSTYSTIYTSIIIDEQISQNQLLPGKKAEEQIAEYSESNENLKKEINQRKETEKALLEYHEQLEKLIKQQAKELNTLNSRLVKETEERKQAQKNARQGQESLVHISRLNSVVDMASGLAHEINQPLSAITTYTQSCLRKINSNEEVDRIKTLLEQVLVQTQRATQIIQHLRDFISKGEPHREATNINKVIQFAIKMLRNEMIKNEIKIDVRQEKPVPQIMANPIQIEQVVLNLIQNAIDALKKVPPPKRELAIDINRTQSHVSITIHDTGPGITQQNADKILKPFFTTKTNGMGLGLAICRAIVEDHGGQVSNRKNTNKGATFQVTLAIDGQNKAD